MERTDPVALVCDVYCDLVTFPFGTLGQVWFLIDRFLILAVFLTYDINGLFVQVLNLY